jgi:tRNA-dihydrouridine synthase
MVRIGNIELGEFPLLLAPMEDVSDPPFRAVCKMNGADLMYTIYFFRRIDPACKKERSET